MADRLIGQRGGPVDTHTWTLATDTDTVTPHHRRPGGLGMSLPPGDSDVAGSRSAHR